MRKLIVRHWHLNDQWLHHTIEVGEREVGKPFSSSEEGIVVLLGLLAKKSITAEEGEFLKPLIRAVDALPPPPRQSKKQTRFFVRP